MDEPPASAGNHAQTHADVDGDDLRSRFIANISHEFRTPLTLILGPTEDILDGAHGPISDAVRRQLQMAVRNGHRLQLLVDQLLDLASAEAGRPHPARQAVNINRFVMRVAGSFAPLAERQSVDLEVALPDAERIVSIDPDQVEKILMNLLSNAFKATSRKGRVEIDLQFDREHLIVAVADDGVGIHPEHLPFIFDRFAQVGAGQSRTRPGSGIGLNLAHELASLHGGSIAVESTPGEGSRFSLRLPLITDEEMAPLAERERAERYDRLIHNWKPDSEVLEDALDRTTVLIVDDDDDIRRLVFDRLADSYRVITAEDGELGLQAAREHLPDVIVSDVMMPYLDGYAFCRMIRADADLSHIPVIMLTSKADRAGRIEGLETGADDYLTKPFDADELRVRIRNLIDLRQGLRDRYSNEISLKATGVTLTSAEARFLEAVRSHIASTFDGAECSVEGLAEAVGLSTSQLQRKLRSMLDETPVHLIRRMRLEHAAQLLEQRAGTISEIAYASGFNSQAYFARAFKQHFGKTPTAFRDDECSSAALPGNR